MLKPCRSSNSLTLSWHGVELEAKEMKACKRAVKLCLLVSHSVLTLSLLRMTAGNNKLAQLPEFAGYMWPIADSIKSIAFIISIFLVLFFMQSSKLHLCSLTLTGLSQAAGSPPNVWRSSLGVQ